MLGTKFNRNAISAHRTGESIPIHHNVTPTVAPVITLTADLRPM